MTRTSVFEQSKFTLHKSVSVILSKYQIQTNVSRLKKDTNK